MASPLASVPTFVAHGTADTVVPPDVGGWESAVAYANFLGIPHDSVCWKEYNGAGHTGLPTKDFFVSILALK